MYLKGKYDNKYNITYPRKIEIVLGSEMQRIRSTPLITNLITKNI